jgi:hypothetical protein
MSAIVDRRFEFYQARRSELLLARFVSGYAAGWSFAVPEAFAEALDIRWTVRMSSKVAEQVRTQGNEIAFKQGDVLHNHQSAYEAFGKFLEGPNPVSLRVVDAVESGWEETSLMEVLNPPVQFRVVSKGVVRDQQYSSVSMAHHSYRPGRVRFAEYRPDARKGALVEVREHDMSQEEFVLLLQSGVMNSKKAAQGIDMRYEVHGNG